MDQKVEISKEEIPGSKRSMHGNTHTTRQAYISTLYIMNYIQQEFVWCNPEDDGMKDSIWQGNCVITETREEKWGGEEKKRQEEEEGEESAHRQPSEAAFEQSLQEFC